uniref:Uncharacterized protein n=1 Tax=Arundo donax TaxID=35708 RepID=A0A0A9H141_ARUDO
MSHPAGAAPTANGSGPAPPPLPCPATTRRNGAAAATSASTARSFMSGCRATTGGLLLLGLERRDGAHWDLGAS